MALCKHGVPIRCFQCSEDKSNSATAIVIRQTKNIQITSWTNKKKFYCPDCNTLLVRDGSLYGCDTCNIDYKLKMKLGV